VTSGEIKNLQPIGVTTEMTKSKCRATASGKTTMPTVLTIGHSTHTWKVFLDLLRAHRVERVIDVRSIPRSRHNPPFNQDTLRSKLRSARIGYVYLRKLGGLRHARRVSSNMGWRNSSFRGFADYMQTSEFDAGLQRLIKLARQKRSALMCAEAVPWRCHRSLIADALTVLGIRVEDIMSKNRSQLHSLTSFARVRRSCITYPGYKDDRPLSSERSHSSQGLRIRTRRLLRKTRPPFGFQC
jgi:Protein of unknown function, DUF488